MVNTPLLKDRSYGIILKRKTELYKKPTLNKGIDGLESRKIDKNKMEGWKSITERNREWLY